MLDNHNKVKKEIEELIKNNCTREDIVKHLLYNGKNVYNFLIHNNRKTFFNKTTGEYEVYYKDLIDAIIDTFNPSSLELEILQECRNLDINNEFCNLGIGIEENEINKLFEQNINISSDEIFKLCPKWYHFEYQDFGIHSPIKLNEVYNIDKYINNINILISD